MRYTVLGGAVRRRRGTIRREGGRDPAALSKAGEIPAQKVRVSARGRASRSRLGDMLLAGDHELLADDGILRAVWGEAGSQEVRRLRVLLYSTGSTNKNQQVWPVPSREFSFQCSPRTS